MKKEQFEALSGAKAPDGYTKRYNAAPTQALPVLTNQRLEQWQLFHWGLVPGWAKSISVGNRSINARIERLEEKPTFRFAYQHQRCLVIADSYYEWKGQGRSKIPFRILPQSEMPFFMAGLWEVWDKRNEPYFSFTIVTKPAEFSAAEIHDRMPIILPKGKETDWLDKAELPIDDNHQYTTPMDLKNYPVGKAVGSVKNDYSELILPSNEPMQGSLF